MCPKTRSLVLHVIVVTPRRASRIVLAALCDGILLARGHSALVQAVQHVQIDRFACAEIMVAVARQGSSECGEFHLGLTSLALDMASQLAQVTADAERGPTHGGGIPETKGEDSLLSKVVSAVQLNLKSANPRLGLGGVDLAGQYTAAFRTSPSEKGIRMGWSRDMSDAWFSACGRSATRASKAGRS